MSRIIHPTSISLEYAARVIRNGQGGLLKVEPIQSSGLASAVFVVDTTRNWLTDNDALNLKGLLIANEKYPFREPLATAFWYHEYASHSYEIEVRWTLVCTGLESLIHTKRNQSTRQFTERIPKLAKEIDLVITKKEAEDMYNCRSTIVHGQELNSSPNLPLYKKMENLLRKVIHKATLDSTFGAFFENKEEISKKWSV